MSRVVRARRRVVTHAPALMLGLAALASLAACSRREGATATKGAPPRSSPAPRSEPFGLGRAPTAEELRAWASAAAPDGAGLPDGHGSVAEGARIYAARCASCHGATGTEGPLDVLVGNAPAQGYRLGKRPVHAAPVTIGNWWPRATALFDYLARAMPPAAPGSLAPGEVYALSAYLLHENGIVPADAVLDRATLPAVKMPAALRFVVDAR